MYAVVIVCVYVPMLQEHDHNFWWRAQELLKSTKLQVSVLYFHTHIHTHKCKHAHTHARMHACTHTHTEVDPDLWTKS